MVVVVKKFWDLLFTREFLKQYLNEKQNCYFQSGHLREVVAYNKTVVSGRYERQLTVVELLVVVGKAMIVVLIGMLMVIVVVAVIVLVAVRVLKIVAVLVLKQMMVRVITMTIVDTVLVMLLKKVVLIMLIVIIMIILLSYCCNDLS